MGEQRPPDAIQMLYNRRVDQILILVIPLALFVYISTKPHLRLRADMPPQFVDSLPSASPKQREEEERLARGYWDCALAFVQWTYMYGSPLPKDPPNEFRITSDSSSGPEPASSSRLRYWRRLREVWLMPSSWKATREWSTQWVTGSFKEAVAWIEGHFQNLVNPR